MISLIDEPMESLKRQAILLILGAMTLGGVIVTVLHSFEIKTHPISLMIPPLTAITCLSLLIYLLRYPLQIHKVIKILLIWSGFVIFFPEYFFVIEAWLDDQKLLVDTLPPMSAGVFLLTTTMIVFLRPRRLVPLTLVIWGTMAAPVVIYLSCHLQELRTPRGLDLMVTFVPAMGINFALILFYARLQDAINQLYIERFHFKEVSERDALTRVFNRGTGEKILQNLIDQRDRQIGIILCDIDRFKQINDNYGHLMGDRVLQLIARCCQDQLRTQDILIRWGGEEFLVVVLGDHEQELVNLAERLRGIIAHQSIPEVGKVTASFGVALLQPQENLSQLFERADQGLYQAKRSGRDRVVLA